MAVVNRSWSNYTESEKKWEIWQKAEGNEQIAGKLSKLFSLIWDMLCGHWVRNQTTRARDFLVSFCTDNPSGSVW